MLNVLDRMSWHAGLPSETLLLTIHHGSVLMKGKGSQGSDPHLPTSGGPPLPPHRSGRVRIQTPPLERWPSRSQQCRQFGGGGRAERHDHRPQHLPCMALVSGARMDRHRKAMDSSCTYHMRPGLCGTRIVPLNLSVAALTWERGCSSRGSHTKSTVRQLTAQS
jgi:hypothetical protein